MQDDFEHKISQQMQEFSISPQPEIWQRVEAALPEKKHRRIAFWWWLLPLVVGAGLGLWWVGNYRSENSAKKVAEHKANVTKPTISTGTETSIIPAKDSSLSQAQKSSTNSKRNSDITAKEAIVVTTENSSSTQVESPAVATKQNTNTSNGKRNTATYSSSVKAIAKANKKKSSSATFCTSNINSISKEKRPDNDERDKVKAKKDLENNNPVNELNSGEELALQAGISNVIPIEVKTDSVVLAPTITPGANDTTEKKEIADAQKNTAQKNEEVVKKKSAKSSNSKKALWLVDAAIGTSWLKGTSSLDKALLDATNQYFSSPGTIGAGTGNSSSFRNFARPGVGYSLSLGFIRRQEFNKHLSWQAALHYQLLSATQRVGSAIDTPSIYSRASAPSLIYNTGNRRTYRNIVHQLQFSPGLVLTVNPTAHSPFSITTGAAAAYNVSNNLLLHDYRSNTYIRSARSSSKIQYSAYLGVDISIQKKLQLGLIYQHSFSNVAKGNLGSDYQWRQLQLHVSLPVSK
jgi:hypothetical protein